MTTASPSIQSVPDQQAILRQALAVVRELTIELHPGMPGVDRLGADASIERDFGLDSLARVELALRIERAFGSALPDATVEEVETVADLVQALFRAGVTPSASPPATLLTPARIESGALATAPATTLVEALEWFATTQASRTHVLLVDRETSPDALTYGALRAEAVAVAAGLIKHGVRPGQTVAIMLPTSREFFAAFYGVLYAQAVPVPLYPPARPSQIESHLRRVALILANCEARVLITFTAAMRVAKLLRSLQTRLEIVTTVGEIAIPQTTFPAPAVRPGDTAFLQYTSGSTGAPKGVVLTHANLLANLQAMQKVMEVTSADCFVSWLPLYHDMGLIGACLGALVYGYPLVLMSPFTFLSHPLRWLRAIERHGGTISAAPNFAFEVCLSKLSDQDLAGLDLSSLRVLANGAEAVSPHTIERFAERFASCGLRRGALMPVYGMAECALGLTFPPLGRGPVIDRIDREKFVRSGAATPYTDTGRSSLSLVSCGKPLPGYAVRIVDAAGTALPERQQGRIEFQGPSATSGYFHNSRDTARLFDGKWLDTGDLGYLASGELYVSGRAKDIIIRGGHNIHPQELEEAIGELPGARKGGAVVFSASDRRSSTERIVVLAETRQEQPAARSELISRINNLAVDLIGMPVDEVLLVPPRTVLKTSSGKIRRAACREAYEHGQLGTAGTAASVQVARLAIRGFLMDRWRNLRRAAEILWGVRVLLVVVCLTPVLWLSVVPVPGAARRLRIGAAVFRLGIRLAGIAPQLHLPATTASQPRVFVCNHSSYLDVPVLAAVLPNVTFVAKRELAKPPLIGLLFRRLGCVFVERYNPREAATAARGIEDSLRSGQSLVVFPEGTFVREPGLLPFHMGAFMAAAATGAVVVPVALRGTRTMLPDGSLLARPAPIDVFIAEPLTPRDNSWNSMLELRRQSRAFIVAHIPEPDREPGPP
jgi:acyl carrier protein